MLNRAYSLLEIRSVDETARRITGMATTPQPDRLGDVIEPLGATFAREIPLLLHHNRQAPVGVARLGPATAAGIAFEAEIARVDEPGPVKDETDRAWQSILHKLLRAVSVGFRPRGSWEDAIEQLKGGGLKFLKTEILELSLVTIPANQQATLALAKSYDLAALGLTSPGGSGPFPVVRVQKDAPPMTTTEQITKWTNTRAPKADKLAAMMKTADDSGVTLDEAQTEEYTTLTSEVKAIDAHIVRLRELETLNIGSAVPVPTFTKSEIVPLTRPAPVIQVKSRLPAGTAFVRYCQAIAYGRGDTMRALEFAKQWNDSTPEVELVLRAAVAPGTTTDATWAGPLVQLQPMANEFLELLRPATILGRIPGLHRVPFNISVPTQTGGGTYGWVGQGAPKPVTKLAFGTTTLTFAKAAGIVVITVELARFSSPAAEDTIRNDMIKGMAAFLDVEFTDPTKAAVTNVSPGSITNGVTPLTTAGTSPANARTDMIALLNAIAIANLPVSQVVFIMSETNALALSSALNPLGQPLFPTMGAAGGTAQGMTVVASQAVGSNVIALVPDAILLADEGGVNIDMSTEASVQLDSAPDNPAVATTILTSLWQNNLIGLRCERFINWKKARAGAVQYTVASYTA